jgi:acetyl-CoA C-acetyltransferase
MREAAIISTARTGVARAFKGAFNDTDAPQFTGHVIKAAIERAGIDPARIDDVAIGVGTQWGTQGNNLARTSLFAAGLPDCVAGTTLDRKCGSGLTTIAYAARGIIAGDLDVVVAGGAESITHTRNAHTPTYRAQTRAVLDMKPYAYTAMIETAEIVAERYGITREAQDEISVVSHQRAAAATAAGRFADEIVPITVTKNIIERDGSISGTEVVTLTTDEGIRADTTLEALAKLKPVWKDGLQVKEGRFITAGNASSFRWRLGAGVDGSCHRAGRRAAGAWPVPRLPVGGLRARGNGHWPRAGHSQAVGPRGAERGGHRPVGNQRGLCQPIPLLPRQAGHRS